MVEYSLGLQLFLTLAVAACVLSLILGIRNALDRHAKLAAIPTVGYSGMLTSFITGFRFFLYSREIMKEGYDKYPDRIFKVAMVDRWLIVYSSPEAVNDVRKASMDQLSSADGLREMLQVENILTTYASRFHIKALRDGLTRDMSARHKDIVDETRAALADMIPLTEDWIKVRTLPVLMRIMARTINRFILGLPMCRDPLYIDAIIKRTVDAATAMIALGMVPGFLKPILAPFAPLVRSHKKVLKILEPYVAERLRMYEIHGRAWEDDPNDLISCLIDAAPEELRTPAKITFRITATNLAGIGSTTSALWHGLNLLASHPEYVETLREEIEGVLSAEPMTKQAVDKFHKLDSFLKEAQRLNSPAAYWVWRKVLNKDFVFSDGTVVPVGGMLGLPGVHLSYDATNFKDPTEFKPLRFYDMALHGAPAEETKLAGSTRESPLFGLGQAKCPGRVLAVTEMKTVIAHILLSYDVKTAPGEGPRQRWWNSSLMFVPDRSAKLMFRKRARHINKGG